MLHWLAGQRQPEGPPDPEATGCVEPPETPAPVFAVRAFKHAIFGTPQTTQPKSRRNSATDNGRPRNGELRPSRPGMTRPKSSNDAQILGRPQQFADMAEPLNSPTKGILLTPGTATAKKKNVTFGDHVMDNECKRPMRNGVKDESPTKAGNVESALNEGTDFEDNRPERPRSRTKLTEAFEQARDESAKKRREKSDKRARKLFQDDVDVPPEFMDPKSDAAKYWKNEYDSYRTTTQREVKKLLTKQKAAKSFAQTMEEQCTDLADGLRHEQNKVETLEAKIEELTTLMKDLSEQLLASKKAAQDRSEEVARLQRQSRRKDSTRPESGDYGALLPLEQTLSAQRAGREAVKADTDPVQRPSVPYQPSKESEKLKMDLQTLRARVKSKPENKATKESDDIWAQSFTSSSPLATRPPERSARPVTVKADNNRVQLNALQTLDVNAVASERDIDRDTCARSSSEEPSHSPLADPCAGAKFSNGTESGDVPPKPPIHTSSLQRPVSADSKDVPESAAATTGKPEDDWSLPIPIFSPVPPDSQSKVAVAVAASRLSPPSATLPTERLEAQPLKSAQASMNTKENISPFAPSSSKPHKTSPGIHNKPSALWSSMNTQSASQRAVGPSAGTTKDGRQVSNDRLEAAKARIQARGRVAS